MKKQLADAEIEELKKQNDLLEAKIRRLAEGR